ncbi:MAG: biotin carboxylase N-terminal domain-containing protein [Desulfovibrionaceae bacterium]|nr:biotin carboxylase N-terminal domain-containing protein [Desulfovibrionaceae bacterium]
MPANKHKVLIANRGEIATRIIRACCGLGLDFVSLATAGDLASGHVSLARELGGEKALYRIESYHDANEILSVADAARATAVHPGYGFFAEDYRFARRTAARDRPLTFIGPSWWAIRDLGDKISTKRIARSLGVPTVPGSDRPVYDELEAEELARALFAFQDEQGVESGCVLVKASAGGGGMGIEEVWNMDRFRSVFRRVRNYAKRHFNDEGVLIEQRILDFNHLEVQIVSERGGRNHVHFGTRNCSIQSLGRQKRIEVAPGFVPGEIGYYFDAAGVLEAITRNSLAMAAEVGYDSVGTWEWIVTPKGEPFLMEVNTRIQVENGVSAAIARLRGEPGVDLVSEHIRLALGEPLGYSQQDLSFEGVGVEYRIVAEDPRERFAPWAGRIERFQWAERPWLTVHSHVPRDAAYDIPMDFDPNLALAIVWGENLAQAKERGKSFLNELVLEGAAAGGGEMRSNIGFLLEKNQNILEF